MATVILPNQLYPEPVSGEEKYIVEHRKFFTRHRFHKQKLVLHRASMKRYAKDKNAEYVEYSDGIESVFENAEKVKMYDPVDHGIRESLEELAEQYSVNLEIVETPGFILSMDFNRKFFEKNEYFHRDYYRKVRGKLNLLVEDGKPVGGKWSFDTENRDKMPEDVQKPEIPQFSSEEVEEAKKYVENNFQDNPGELDEFFWPTNRVQALENLEDFLEKRLEKFGDYQDAIDSDLRYGFHSLLSSSLNIGLITPEEVVEKTMEHHEEKDYPMNSLEGFLRQIIGWREFIRAIYELEPGMCENNFFGHSREMPGNFYSGDTGIPPVDDSIQNALSDAYCHHIERLMVLGNIMLLLEIDPDDVYRWFMEMFIDSYEWVMVPNIYGMSQYSYTRMMTKPYISSSNYIRNMSHYEGGEWEDYWGALYWDFVRKNRDKLDDIQRMNFIISNLDGMSDEKLEDYSRKAREFRENLRQG